MTEDQLRRLRRVVVLLMFVALGVAFGTSRGGQPVIWHGQPVFNVHGTLYPTNWVLWWMNQVLFPVAWIVVFVTVVLTQIETLRRSRRAYRRPSASGFVVASGPLIYLPTGVLRARLVDGEVTFRRFVLPPPLGRAVGIPLGSVRAVRIDCEAGSWRLTAAAGYDADDSWSFTPLDPRRWAKAFRDSGAAVLPADLDLAALPRVQWVVVRRLWMPLLAHFATFAIPIAVWVSVVVWLARAHFGEQFP